MLSRLSSYIFGGLFGAPDAETTPLRYETREAAGDWLLVDMPDQAIDDEDMDSDSEEDDILAAVPMLMSENGITEQPGIVLTYEEARDSSICDNYNKIQNSCYVDIQDNSDTKILNISDIQALALGQVKEIKPAQEAIQFESKKYLTRSHLNRQNKNYLYQSSVKTNRRRNLQRNHSGANNNRKC